MATTNCCLALHLAHCAVDALIGNSVCPHVARALVHAQVNAGERREAA